MIFKLFNDVTFHDWIFLLLCGLTVFIYLWARGLTYLVRWNRSFIRYAPIHTKIEISCVRNCVINQYNEKKTLLTQPSASGAACEMIERALDWGKIVFHLIVWHVLATSILLMSFKLLLCKNIHGSDWISVRIVALFCYGL